MNGVPKASSPPRDHAGDERGGARAGEDQPARALGVVLRVEVGEERREREGDRGHALAEVRDERLPDDVHGHHLRAEHRGDDDGVQLLDDGAGDVDDRRLPAVAHDLAEPLAAAMAEPQAPVGLEPARRDEGDRPDDQLADELDRREDVEARAVLEQHVDEDEDQDADDRLREGDHVAAPAPIDDGREDVERQCQDREEERDAEREQHLAAHRHGDTEQVREEDEHARADDEHEQSGRDEEPEGRRGELGDLHRRVARARPRHEVAHRATGPEVEQAVIAAHEADQRPDAVALVPQVMDEEGRLNERDRDRDRVADGIRDRGARRGWSGHDVEFGC
jgi:hypothetical protein